MISHDHKCIFLHIPKTGGISFKTILSQNVTVDNKFKGGHPKLSYYSKVWNINSYFKFCFVRNPWDRLLSCYIYLKGGGRNNCRHDIEAGKVLKDIEFLNFIKNIYNYNFLHIRPQMYFIEDISNFDFIGRFETLQEDFNIVCDKIGIPRQQLPHINKSKHKHYTEYYNEEAKQIVAEKYAQDIEYFGYEFGE